MNGAGSKAKGSSFERQICKQLSLWMSRNMRDDLFWRSAMSGGRATVKFKTGGRNATQAGDISAIDSQGERLTKYVLIECKFYKDLQLDKLFMLANSRLAEFWFECVRQAERQAKLPMLIAKQNRSDVLVCLPERGPMFFKFDGAVKENSDFPIAKIPRYDMKIIPLDVFLQYARRP